MQKLLKIIINCRYLEIVITDNIAFLLGGRFSGTPFTLIWHTYIPQDVDLSISQCRYQYGQFCDDLAVATSAHTVNLKCTRSPHEKNLLERCSENFIAMNLVFMRPHYERGLLLPQVFAPQQTSNNVR